MMRKLLSIILISNAIILWASATCLADGYSYALSRSLSHIENTVTQNSISHQGSVQSMRDNAIKRAGIVYGAQSGRYYRWKQIQSLLLDRTHLLSRVFNFGSMYLNNALVQPPVLDMSSNVTTVSNSGQMRKFINDVYRVLIPATFRSTPVQWQSFLLPDRLSKPTSPREALLPRNNHEKQLWLQMIQKGWGQGVVEANSEFSTRLTSLNNAYQGMVLYTMLAMRGMVAPPRIIKVNKTVKNSADGQTMAVGIHKQVISKNSYFVARPNHWKPVFYQHNFSLQGYIK